MTTSEISFSAGMELMHPIEVAEFLRVSRVTIYRLAASGLIPVYRVCHKMLFKRQEILDYLERTKTDFYGRSKD